MVRGPAPRELRDERWGREVLLRCRICEEVLDDARVLTPALNNVCLLDISPISCTYIHTVLYITIVGSCSFVLCHISYSIPFHHLFPSPIILSHTSIVPSYSYISIIYPIYTRHDNTKCIPCILSQPQYTVIWSTVVL